jgi:hypothetical protein
MESARDRPHASQRLGVCRLFRTHLPEQNIDMPPQRGANHIGEPSSSFFQHFVMVKSGQLGFVFRMCAPISPNKVIVLHREFSLSVPTHSDQPFRLIPISGSD